MTYKDEVKKHLATYKIDHLGVIENGTWKTNKKKYAYIVPDNQKELNLLEPYRMELKNYIGEKKIHLHKDFHHLTSSQAVCLNFFYPLTKENKLYLLLKILQLNHEEIEEYGFEKVITRAEGTNFDFYNMLASGKQLFFEIKYTEDGFKKETPAIKYQNKYDTVYKKRLAGKLKPGIDEYGTLMKNYQVMRNISYVDATEENMVIILYPKGNQKIRKEYEHLIENVIEKNLHPNIRLITWEDLCSALVVLLQSSPDTPERLLTQYKDFREKYLTV